MTELAASAAVQADYYYRVRWGHVSEWLELFDRNHYPVLAAQMATGRILDVRCFVPRFHGDGRADWNVLVTIVWRDWAAMEEHSDPGLLERLYPDQERFKAEEVRRFELLDAHWDVPLEAHPLPR
jgi:hypothetical protein